MSTAGNSYEAWKESLKQAEAAGGAEWSEDGEPGTSTYGLGSTELKGLSAGVLLGVGLIFASCIILLPNFRHFTRGERTVGMVVGTRNLYNRRSAKMYAPVVSYSAPGGAYRVVGSLSVASSVYPVGKEVPVLYLRDNPRNAVIADFVQMFLIPTVVGGLGLACLSVTVGIMFWIIRGELPAIAAAAVGTAPKPAPPAWEDGAKAENVTPVAAASAGPQELAS